MSGVIRKPKSNFTHVSNTILRDNRISFKAKGLFCYMFSMVDGWNFTIRSIATQQRDGQASVKSALDELKEYGYIEYEKHNDGTGTYTLNDEPNIENPNVDNPNLRKSTPIKKNQLDKNNNCKEKSKPKKDSYTPAFDELWNEYNPDSQKGDKKKAFTAYLKAVKKHTFNELFMAVRKENKKTFGQRHLSTLFNSDIVDFLKQKDVGENKVHSNQYDLNKLMRP